MRPARTAGCYDDRTEQLKVLKFSFGKNTQTSRASISPNGRRFLTLGRAQPGRAPNVGGAARRSAAEPQGALGYKRRAETVLVSCWFFLAY
jgi:hypothetical protein